MSILKTFRQKGQWVSFTQEHITEGSKQRMNGRECVLALGFKAAGFTDVFVRGWTVDLNGKTYQMEGEADEIHGNVLKFVKVKPFQLFVPVHKFGARNAITQARAIPKPRKGAS